jgi:hypothetical protein
MELTYGARQVDRRVVDVAALLRDWHERESEAGQPYLVHNPATPRDRLVVEDLAVTMLVNSNVSRRAAWGVHENGASLDLRILPDKALEDTTEQERLAVASVIGEGLGRGPKVAEGATAGVRVMAAHHSECRTRVHEGCGVVAAVAHA